METLKGKDSFLAEWFKRGHSPMFYVDWMDDARNVAESRQSLSRQTMLTCKHHLE